MKKLRDGRKGHFFINIFFGWGTWHFVYIVIEGPGAT